MTQVTLLNVNSKITTIRYTDNKDIIKSLSVKKCSKRNYSGMQIEFNELKSIYKAYISFDNKWIFTKGNTQLHEMI